MEKLPKKIVILMRHAKSDWDTGLTDIERPLNRRGVGDAEKMASYLGSKLAGPVKVLASTARRSRDTAAALIRALPQASLVVEENLYLASTRALFELIEENSSEECVILIGHNPGLEQLVEYIDPAAGSRLTSKKLFPTCAVYAYSVSSGVEDDRENNQDHDFQYLFHQRPKDLG